MEEKSLENLDNLIGKIGDNFSILALSSPQPNAFNEPTVKLNVWGVGYSIATNTADDTFEVAIFGDTDLEILSPLTADDIIGLIAEKSNETMVKIYSNRGAYKHNILI